MSRWWSCTNFGKSEGGRSYWCWSSGNDLGHRPSKSTFNLVTPLSIHTFSERSGMCKDRASKGIGNWEVPDSGSRPRVSVYQYCRVTLIFKCGGYFMGSRSISFQLLMPVKAASTSNQRLSGDPCHQYLTWYKIPTIWYAFKFGRPIPPNCNFLCMTGRDSLCFLFCYMYLFICVWSNRK